MDCATAEVVCYWFLTAEAQVQSQNNLWGFMVGRVALEWGFFLVSLSLPVPDAILCVTLLLVQCVCLRIDHEWI